MKVKTIGYSRLFQIPGSKFENERITLEAEISPQEDPIPHMEELKHLAYRCSASFARDVRLVREILADPKGYSNRDVLWAEDFAGTYGLQVPKKPKQTRLKI